MAIEVLKKSPMAEGDFYPGDLLKNTLAVNADYWNSHLDEKKQVEEMFINNQEFILSYDVSEEIKSQIITYFERLLLG